jgi:hypothetical protein
MDGWDGWDDNTNLNFDQALFRFGSHRMKKMNLSSYA